MSGPRSARGMRPAEAAMLRSSAPKIPGSPGSPWKNALPENHRIPALLRENVRRSAERHVPLPLLRGKRPAPGAPRFPRGRMGRLPGRRRKTRRPALFQGPLYDKGGGKPPPFFSGGMPLRAFRLQSRRIIRTPGPWRTRSGRCCGGCRRRFPKADSRRQSADRPWGNASALRGPRSCRPCRTHWSTARCRR